MMRVMIVALPDRDCTWVENHDMSCDECWDEGWLAAEILVNLRHRVDKPGITVSFGNTYTLHGGRDYE